ncbi:MAG TPA: tRNA (adenosine(37)-N6)-dimethylallyltransferase MiaA [Polyangiales bacterium]|nr:tRNA (adenosine(37)-N6)-dimethylallyltransferase MiaA [Polyangiales bacterium]
MLGADPLLVITGPTASGKTALAVELARAWDGELIGADSVQVYRGFDVGSSKPTEQELGGIPHHLIDVRDPLEDLDAAGFAQLADAAIADVRARGKLPILVGGSGLWLRALLRGLVELPAVSPVLRAALVAEAVQLGTPALHTRLGAIDPLAAAKIHPNDTVRVTRALEVHAQTGKPLGAMRAEHALGEPRYRALRVILDWPNELLYPRIAQRTQEMFARGFVDEVRTLLERCPAARALGAVGYRELVRYLRDGGELEPTIAAVERATRIYARRQRTWLKNEPGDRLLAQPDDPQLRERLARFVGR